ncbi:MAG TPA: hypothetical protein VMX74_06125 [Pirellulales bacterium]|nr:hypothetical protein [Pirellulales bacterium]
MKAKRRQELQTNNLADMVGGQIEGIKPYTTWIAAAALAIVVGVVLLSVRSARQKRELNDGWNQYGEARDQGFSAAAQRQPVELTDSLAQLQGLADQFSGQQLGVLARLSMADIYLVSGQSQLRENEVAANDHFKKAADEYGAVAAAMHDPTLVSRALFSMGKSYEWQRQFKKAKETYAQVEDPFRGEAQSRIKQLQGDWVNGFYEKFVAWKPKPPPQPPGDAPDFKLDDEPPEVTGEIDYQSYLDDTAFGLDAE